VNEDSASNRSAETPPHGPLAASEAARAQARDTLFDAPNAPPGASFDFGREVVRVFDDMVSRSVPMYEAVQGLSAALVLRCRAEGAILDLGCSTGTTFQALIERSDTPLDLVGVDLSEDMLDACRRKITPLLGHHRLTLHRGDLEDGGPPPGGDYGAVILSLVLQFLRPRSRERLLAACVRRLRPGGCLVLVEKTVHASPVVNKIFIDCYHDYKHARGYSRTEIARKREALENRLIPFRPEENLSMLREAGFAEAEIFFSWLNFQGYVALKSVAG
jgi:tRNA (cmo5U34)-methyltransferase